MRRTGIRLRAASAALAATVVLTLGACRSGAGDERGAGPTPEPIPSAAAIVDGTVGFPSQTLEDLVTYADFAVQATVLRSDASEFKQRHPSGARWTDRTVELRIDEVLWRGQKAGEAPSSVVYPSLGWARDPATGDDVPMAFEGRPWLVVGHTYFVMLYTSIATGDPMLTVGPAGAVLPMDDGLIGSGENLGGAPGPAYTGAQALHGANAVEARAMLARTQIDPRAQNYLAMPAEERYAAVVAGNASPRPTSPLFPTAAPAPS